MRISKVFWLFLFLMLADMFVIFMFSAQSADKSTQISQTLATDIIEKTGKSADELSEIEFFNVERFVRKTAHVVLYTALGVFSCLTYKAGVCKSIKWYVYVISFAFCVLYAISDEYHQTFIQGRDGNAIDVFIDSCGSLVGILGIWLATKKFSFGIK